MSARLLLAVSGHGFGHLAQCAPVIAALRARRPEVEITLREAYQGARRILQKDGHRLEVTIPPGSKAGTRVRMSGEGGQGAAGGESGDLYLRVRMAKHPDLEVDGHDLIYEAELAPWEAVLGAEISVPTLAGRVNIKIPAGTQDGQKLRVRGRGLPSRENGNGDLFVVARIVVPSKITDAERKLWEQLKRESKFNPRI